jgi:hypothetical protein
LGDSLNFLFLDIEDFPFMGECLEEQTGTPMLPSHVLERESCDSGHTILEFCEPMKEGLVRAPWSSSESRTSRALPTSGHDEPRWTVGD